MELTLESAFSTGGLVGHTAFLLLVISMMMRNLTTLRILVIISTLFAIAYDGIWLSDPVGVFWETLLVLVNIVQLSIIYFENRRARFSDEESEFIAQKLPNLEKGFCRRLLNQGLWISGEKGAELTQQGEPVKHLIYLADGEAVIHSGGKAVATCTKGSFIGEMTVLNAEPATGTAILDQSSRYWMIEADALRKLTKSKPEIGEALNAAFTIGLKDKLQRSNQLISTVEMQAQN